MRRHVVLRNLVLAVGLGILTVPSFAIAQQQPGGGRRMPTMPQLQRQQRWWQAEATAATLQLSSSQRERLDAVADRFEEQGKKLRSSYMQSYRLFMDTLANYDAGAETIAKQRAAFEAARSALIASSVDQLLETRSILTAEQWAKLPEAAPQALRLGQVSLRGTGVISTQPKKNEDKTNEDP